MGVIRPVLLCSKDTGIHQVENFRYLWLQKDLCTDPRWISKFISNFYDIPATVFTRDLVMTKTQLYNKYNTKAICCKVQKNLFIHISIHLISSKWNTEIQKWQLDNLQIIGEKDKLICDLNHKSYVTAACNMKAFPVKLQKKMCPH